MALQTGKMPKEKGSQCHKSSVEAVVTLPQTTQNVGKLLSTECARQKAVNRQYISLATDYLRYVA